MEGRGARGRTQMSTPGGWCRSRQRGRAIAEGAVKKIPGSTRMAPLREVREYRTPKHSLPRVGKEVANSWIGTLSATQPYVIDADNASQSLGRDASRSGARRSPSPSPPGPHGRHTHVSSEHRKLRWPFTDHVSLCGDTEGGRHHPTACIERRPSRPDRTTSGTARRNR